MPVPYDWHEYTDSAAVPDVLSADQVAEINAFMDSRVLAPSKVYARLLPGTEPVVDEGLLKRKDIPVFAGKFHRAAIWYWRIFDAIREINLERWDFEMRSLSRSAVEFEPLRGMQLAQFDVGGHFDWHRDWSMSNEINRRRKLVAVIQLSDDTDYEGGDLEVFGWERRRALRTAGSMLVFPSFFHHRVTPVTKGRSRSLVTWVFGKQVLR